MATAGPCSRIARFDQFEVDLASGELRKSGLRVPLQDQPFQILRLLIEAAPEVVTREQINSSLWPANTFVDFDLAINTAVRKLRQALEDSVDHPKFIQTLAKRGYRFIPSVVWVADPTASALLEEMKVLPSAPAQQPNPDQPTWLGRNQKYIFTAVGVSLLAAALALFYHRPHALAGPLKIVPLTTLPGQEISPSFSPDGSQVAFGWDGENNGAGFDLYVKVIGTDKPLRLTNHPVPWLGVAWSPDGRYIAVHRLGSENGGIFLVPALGGPERRLASASVNDPEVFPLMAPISWSPDGKQLAFEAHRPGTNWGTDQLFLLSLDTLEQKPVETECDVTLDPAFSPKGDKLAYVCRSDDPMRFSLNLRELGTSKDTPLQQLRGPFLAGGIAWSRDGVHIIFPCDSSSPFPSPGGDLCKVPATGNGSIGAIPFVHDVNSPAVSSSGNRLAYAESHVNENIWRVELDTAKAQAALAPSTREQYGPVISPDGKRIAFMSTRSGSEEIWVSDSDGGNIQQLTSFGHGSPGTPHWSPDSRQIAFDARVTPEASVYVVDVDRGVPRKLDTGTHENSLPSWSHDGRWIYFASGPTYSSLTLWRVPVEGGKAMQIVKTHSTMPIESSDGQYVYFVRPIADKPRLWRIRLDGSDENMISGVPPLATDGYEWWLTERGIYFYAYPNGKAEVDFLDFRTSLVHRIYKLDKPPVLWVGGLSVSPDGKWFVYSRVDEVTSDLMLVENFQ